MLSLRTGQGQGQGQGLTSLEIIFLNQQNLKFCEAHANSEA